MDSSQQKIDGFSTSSVMQSLALDKILYRNCAAEVGLNTVGGEKMSCHQIARMSQELSRRLGSVGYNSNESPIYNSVTSHLWTIY